MTAPAPTLTPDQNTDRGYQWYLENLDEILETKTRLQILTDLESDLFLPAGTPFALKHFTQKRSPSLLTKMNDMR